MNAFRRIHREASEPAPSAAERRARNLDLCEELVALGMWLARAAAERARDDIAAPPPIARISYSAAAEVEQWKEEARRRRPDYGKLFTHLSRAVRQTMLLETFLAEGHTPSPGTHAATDRPAGVAAPNPRPPNPHPDSDTMRHETVERLDCTLPIDSNGDIHVEDLLITIGEHLGVQVGTADITADRQEATSPAPALPDTPTRPKLAQEPDGQPPAKATRQAGRRR